MFIAFMCGSTNIFTHLPFQILRSETAAAFLREFPVGSVEDSLAGFAETGTEPYTGTSGPTWAQYVEYYGDSEWLKTNVRDLKSSDKMM